MHSFPKLFHLALLTEGLNKHWGLTKGINQGKQRKQETQCNTREIPGDGGSAKVIAPGEPDPRHLNAVPPFMFAINIHHYLEQRKDISGTGHRSKGSAYHQLLQDRTHRQMPLDIANYEEGVITEIADNGCAAPKLCGSPIPLMIIAEGAVVHHG